MASQLLRLSVTYLMVSTALTPRIRAEAGKPWAWWGLYYMVYEVPSKTLLL